MRPELREDVGHLEGASHRICGPVDPLLCLLTVLDREDAERDRDTGLDRGQLKAARSLACDQVEMRRLTADHTAERDDARVPARLRESHRRQRKLEGSRDGHDHDRLARHADLLQLGERSLEQAIGDLAVVAADDDPDRAAAVGASAESAVALGNTKLAFGVLVRGFRRRRGRPESGNLTVLRSVGRRLGRLGRLRRLGRLGRIFTRSLGDSGASGRPSSLRRDSISSMRSLIRRPARRRSGDPDGAGGDPSLARFVSR